MSESFPHQQQITGVTAHSYSRVLVGSFRDVHITGSAASEEAAEKAVNTCRNDLFLTDPHVDREMLISAKGMRAPGTCEWITQNESYQSWLYGDAGDNMNGGTRLLWISGGPGKGKSMMALYLTEELEKHTETLAETDLMFFFCSAQDEKRNTAVAVLRGLVRQIVIKRPQLAKYALPYLETPEMKQQTLSSLEAPWIVFSKMVADTELGTMFCVLDGLDECEASAVRVLLPKIRALLAGQSVLARSGIFKLVIVSRDIHELRGCTRVRLDPENDEKVASDIDRFVSAKVKELLKIEGFRLRDSMLSFNHIFRQLY